MAVAAVLALAAVNYRGVTRTARLTRVIVVVVLLALVTVVAAGLFGGRVDPGPVVGELGAAGAYEVLQSAACPSSPSPATRGSRPWARRCGSRSGPSPRAIPPALGIAVAVYAVVAVTALLTLARSG